MAYANSPQWAFLHWWRALPETFVHFLMFNDTLKSFFTPFPVSIVSHIVFQFFDFFICYSPLVAKSPCHVCNILAVKEDWSLALTCERCLVLIFFWPTSWILLKQYYSSRPHGLWVNSPFGLLPHGLLTHSPFGLEE